MEVLSASDHWENAKLVTILQFGVKVAVAGRDHGNADGVDIDFQIVNNFCNRRLVRIFFHFLDKAAFTEEGKESDRDLHLKIPK